MSRTLNLARLWLSGALVGMAVASVLAGVLGIDLPHIDLFGAISGTGLAALAVKFAHVV